MKKKIFFCYLLITEKGTYFLGQLHLNTTLKQNQMKQIQNALKSLIPSQNDNITYSLFFFSRTINNLYHSKYL